MSFKKEWGLDQRVITKDGLGKIVSYQFKPGIKLDKPVAGAQILLFEEGEVVVESNFSLIRIINTWAGILSVGQNFPSWEGCLAALSQPFSQDETMLALNFENQKLKTNRLLSGERYHLIETCLDRYHPMENICCEGIEEAQKIWKERLDCVSGTSGCIMLFALLDFKDNRIFSKALFTTLEVVEKETWW